jgi:hypothetical protein
MEALHESRYKDLILNSPTPNNTARIRANEGETAGAFLWAIPSTPNTTLSNSAFKAATKRRLGHNLLIPNRCKCGQVITDTGSHFLTCSHGKGNYLRHNQVKHLFLQLSKRAGYTVQDEPHLLNNIEDNKKGKRGDGLIYHASQDQKNIIFDVTFTDPQSTSNLNSGAHRDVNNALRTRETHKTNKYRVQMNSVMETTTFLPLAMTTYGSINDHTRSLISQLSTRVAEITGVPKSIITRQTINELSVMIAKTNGEIIMNHCTANGRGQDYLLNDPETILY